VEGRSLLVSDVDGTLLGDDRALERFARWCGERRGQLALAYSSGRFCKSIAESVHHTQLPQPDAIIGGVGTEICLYPAGDLLGEWSARFEPWYPETVRAALADFDELELQPAELLSRYKISYYVYDAAAELLERMAGALATAGLRAKLVYSSARDLDVLPAAADKGAAAAFLAEYWNLPHQRVLVAGDSGNDLAMFQQGFRGIIVANAHGELAELDSPRVYKSHRPYADGVLDGLQYWLAECGARS
jgi:sucrose-6F-phosphate phosphohydrolase